MQKIVALYLVGTFLAAVVAVVASFLFPMELVLKGIESANMSAPQGIVDVLKDLIFKMVQNPISAISSGNYIGIITWAVGGGIAMRFCTPETKKVFQDVSDGVTKIVRFIIRLAPFGIFGLRGRVHAAIRIKAFERRPHNTACAPTDSTISGTMALTLALVPTTINAGVLISPCGV